MDEKELKKGMENVSDICKKLEEVVKSEMAKGLDQVDTKELGLVIDMMKDCADAIEKKAETEYYCKITKAMKDAEEEDELMSKLGIDDERRGYNNYRYMRTGEYAPTGRGTYRRGYNGEDAYRMNRVRAMDMERPDTRMYYNSGTWQNSDNQRYYGGSDGSSMSGGNSYMNGMSNYSESRYDRARRNYTETRDTHKDNTQEDKNMKMQELEKYMSELSTDLSDVINNATPEEKNLMRQKMSTLVSKI